MRINQCHISKSVCDFPFKAIYNLSDYMDSLKPCLFFGVYREEDISHIKNHLGVKMIFWCGQDVLWIEDKDVDIYNSSLNFCVMPLVYQALMDKGIKNVRRVKMPVTHGTPLIRGKNIYAYTPFAGDEDYHKKELIENLGHQNIIYGTGKIPQTEWPKVCDDIYGNCFVGLVLNDHAGGGATINELGLRGIRVVTNVSDLPHCIGWKSVDDIKRAIVKESQYIGTKNRILSNRVREHLDDKHEWLYL